MTFVVVADLVQSLAVGDGEVENGRASLTRFPGERGLADPDLPPVQGKPDRPDLSAREDRGYFYGFIDLDRHEDQYSEHLFTCQGAAILRGKGQTGGSSEKDSSALVLVPTERINCRLLEGKRE